MWSIVTTIVFVLIDVRIYNNQLRSLFDIADIYISGDKSYSFALWLLSRRTCDVKQHNSRYRYDNENGDNKSSGHHRSNSTIHFTVTQFAINPLRIKQVGPRQLTHFALNK